MGFKPRDAVPSFHSIHFPLIIYPNDKEVQGSTAAFAQLHAAMLRNNVVAIGEAHHREHWQSRLVAIFPLQKTPSDEDSGKPAGMLVVKLPFEDDIRAIAPDEASNELEMLKSRSQMIDDKRVSSNGTILSEHPEPIDSAGDVRHNDRFSGSIAAEELVAAATKMVAKMTVNRNSDLVDVSNDSMENFYSYLKSVALDLPRERVKHGDKVYASMLPSKTLAAIESFFLLLPEDATPQKTGSDRRKRTKDLPPDETGIDWKTLYEADKLASCKNEELKACLRSFGKS